MITFSGARYFSYLHFKSTFIYMLYNYNILLISDIALQFQEIIHVVYNFHLSAGMYATIRQETLWCWIAGGGLR